MWVFNNNNNKWLSTNDSLSKDEFDNLKQELSSVRFYSKCLSGATFLPINNINNIYDILGEYEPKSWFINTSSSPYSISPTPIQHSISVDRNNSDEFYEKYIGEYGLTLKNSFTPENIINDSVKNYIYVDVATTELIEDLNTDFVNIKIDGVRLKDGHRVLIKDQKTRETLLSTIDPATHFKGRYEIIQNLGGVIEYEYFNEDNGIYTYINRKLVKDDILDIYDNCVRFSIISKLGDVNREKQWHLVRLKNGFFPTTKSNDPIEFEERHNYLLRNRVDYNNLFEINYYDVISNPTQSYTIDDITYTIPERTISIGEFGIILNTQKNTDGDYRSHVIFNRYKVNLRSISETSTHYWICGDSATLLKVRKHDFFIEKIELTNIVTNLKSISFFNNTKGVVVGEYNTILATDDGGYNWNEVRYEEFDSFSFNKVVYCSIDKFIVGGNAGIFVEIKDDLDGWIAHRRRISKYFDDEEYLLIEHINDMFLLQTDKWNLQYGYQTNINIENNKNLLFIVTNNNNLIIYDIDNTIPGFDFYYIDLGEIGDIKSINYSPYVSNNGLYYISTNDKVYEFDINNAIYLLDPESNNIKYTTTLNTIFNGFVNEVKTDENYIIICGNNSLLLKSEISNTTHFSGYDETFESKLKSKLLFLDYDIGSKLNFFDDDQNYRLPNDIVIDTTVTPIDEFIFFDKVTKFSQYSQTNYTESNWLEYYQDRMKTFEYYNDDLISDSSKVLMSYKFSLSNINSSITMTGSSVRTELSDIEPLAPTINIKGHSRYNRGNNSPIVDNSTSNNPRLYLYDYLGILRVPSNFPVDKGDVLSISSSVVDTKIIINKIFQVPNSTRKYLYFYTEFNQNIITELKKVSNNILIVNTNKFSDLLQFMDRVSLHPISDGYNFNLLNNNLTISAKFNNLTAYYNMEMSVYNGVLGSPLLFIYKSGFINFGFTPTYNLLGFLENINAEPNPALLPKFYSDKEYLAMPIYYNLPLDQLTPNTLYIDTNFVSNKILFGKEFEFEWKSLFINTFVDVEIINKTNINNKFVTKKLLILKKYYDSNKDCFVIEFHKKLNYDLNINIANYYINISSRRTLKEISDDLGELNNIHRNKNDRELAYGVTFSNYENEINFRFSTDSYAKILLSDSVTVDSLSGIIYTDYKNELSLNITKLEREVTIPIINVLNFSGKAYIMCSEKHGLSTDDGVTLEFNGGLGSSEEINQQYFGFHNVTVDGEFTFYVNVDYGLPTTNDAGFVRYIKKDPFLNYQPIDIIDVGVDKKTKQSIELQVKNLKLIDDKFSLVDVDYNKYRIKMVDGLNIDIIASKYPWILEAEISDAILGMDDEQNLIWYKGIWECGRWFGGTWISGTWISGDWYDGRWESKSIKDKLISVDIDNTTYSEKNSQWYGGRWFDGTWNGGTWRNGRWYEGTWNDGKWYNGIWNDGTWLNGKFMGGIWVLGTWQNGIFNTDSEPAYWLDGKWYGGDFENGMWYNGIFEQKNTEARFGVKSYNSRTSTWHGGKWISGSFHSQLNTENGEVSVSENHKYSIWKTGLWMSGDWYGGIAFNMDFRSGTWHGGIMEEIQVIGFHANHTMPSGSTASAFILNGIFKFNIGDDFHVIGTPTITTYNTLGNNDAPKRYTVLYVVEDNDKTVVYTSPGINITQNPSYETHLRVVSRMKVANWKSGIWTNGIFENGLWEGGIWYNGVFGGTWG
jgi:hypothetical protein